MCIAVDNMFFDTYVINKFGIYNTVSSVFALTAGGFYFGMMLAISTIIKGRLRWNDKKYRLVEDIGQ